MNDTKRPWSSLGIVAPAVTMIVYLVNMKWPGLGLGEGEVNNLIDQLGVFVAGATAIWGRWRATKEVTLAP